MFQILAILGLLTIMSGGSTVFLTIYCILWMPIMFFCIKNNANRWKASALALAAFLFVCGLGVLALFMLLSREGSLLDVNEVIDKVRTVVEVCAPLAAITATIATPGRNPK